MCRVSIMLNVHGASCRAFLNITRYATLYTYTGFGVEDTYPEPDDVQVQATIRVHWAGAITKGTCTLVFGAYSRLWVADAAVPACITLQLMTGRPTDRDDHFFTLSHFVANGSLLNGIRWLGREKRLAVLRRSDREM